VPSVIILGVIYFNCCKKVLFAGVVNVSVVILSVIGLCLYVKCHNVGCHSL
jgi:hypothetical protein